MRRMYLFLIFCLWGITLFLPFLNIMDIENYTLVSKTGFKILSIHPILSALLAVAILGKLLVKAEWRQSQNGINILLFVSLLYFYSVPFQTYEGQIDIISYLFTILTTAVNIGYFASLCLIIGSLISLFILKREKATN